MRSAIVPMARPCSRAKRSSSGRRAIVPSSFSTSTITAAGSKPASRARSQPASVWPARVSTPPGRAISGNTWPGWRRSSGRASVATAARTVRARSCAEMPVVTPSAASMLTVKFVPCRSSASRTISGNRSRRQRSSVSVRQIRPRPCRAMKLMSSGRTQAAAMTRSPSFSRSSSSMTTTMRPAASSARISSIVFTACPAFPEAGQCSVRRGPLRDSSPCRQRGRQASSPPACAAPA